ncbi:MAG: phospholipid carrier-dependent glycosyltransferase [Planctomycetota bacterium]|nr:MAG: phospholipid carrier-dependent glycosyltransferase [Planctomycetota bacterium]
MLATLGQGFWRGAILPLLLLTFLVCLFPLASDYVLFHPDERHYVDAGLEMLDSGDYLSPRRADGGLRLKKPVIPYWFVTAGFHAVGVSVLGSRIVFLLAGAALIALSWWTAWIAFESRKAALFAAVAAMCHPALLISAPRSIPDICLALSILISTAGFVGILKQQRVSLGWLLLAYGGGALAVLSKGLPAAAFVGYASLFVLIRTPQLVRRNWAAFLTAGIMCAAVSASWFVLMAQMHQEELVQQFTRDQVGHGRFARSHWQTLIQFPMCLGMLAVTLSPWLIPAARGLRSRSRQFRSILRQPHVQLLLGWSLLFCVLASFINHVTMRYLLPVVPALAIVCGGLLSRCDSRIIRTSLRWVLLCALPCLAVGAALAVLGASGRSPVLITGVLAACAVPVLWRLSSRFSSTGQGVATSVVWHAAVLLGTLGISPFVLPDFGDRVIARLHEVNADPAQPVVLIGDPAHATRIRLSSRNETKVIRFKHPEEAAVAEPQILVLEEGALPISELATHRLAEVPCGFHPLSTNEVVTAAVEGKLPRLLDEHRRHYVLAVPKDEIARTAHSDSQVEGDEIVR